MGVRDEWFPVLDWHWNIIVVRGGIVDEDYRGNLGVILYNHSDIPFIVARGDRIAQLLC
jgi:dUTP pyrophosphatase